MRADQGRRKQAGPPRADSRAGPRHTQYMDGAGATGENRAHGNMPNNQGMRPGDPAAFGDEERR